MRGRGGRGSKSVRCSTCVNCMQASVECSPAITPNTTHTAVFPHTRTLQKVTVCSVFTHNITKHECQTAVRQ